FVVIVSENQEKIAEGLAKAGVAINRGWFHDLTEEKLLQDVLVLVGERKIREELSQKGQQLVDGHGAERVLSKMMSR
ncbi:MAG: UDP-2,4-diacetamido-2,4,6-trideoxy-beta-L-altropyranose hydrolase, partial [Candidatus Hermodarchaeia archaeon]